MKSAFIASARLPLRYVPPIVKVVEMPSSTNRKSSPLFELSMKEPLAVYTGTSLSINL
jgi:hypothetical protein